MRNKLLFKFALISIAIGLFVGLLGAQMVRVMNGSAYEEFKRGEILFIARILESAPYLQSMEVYEKLHSDSPTTKALLWIVDGNGRLIIANTPLPLPLDWSEIPRPEAVHQYLYKFRPFRVFPEAIVVRLEGREPAYLLIKKIAGGQRKDALQTIILFLFLAVVGAVFLALLGTFLYLRSKSKEAHGVLVKLAGGDLRARFKIRQFDEVGSLMLEFNKMADEIERLFRRVEATERERLRMIAELSHDLRTPLTSLRTSVDTLTDFYEEIPASQRREFMKMIQGEISYFSRMMDDLNLIAQLGDPKYRSLPEIFNVKDLLKNEVELQQTQEQTLKRGVAWTFESAQSDGVAMHGDAYLVRRMFRNAFENAARYAKGSVHARISSTRGEIQIQIMDDGPGMSVEAIAGFGVPKRHRVLAEGRSSSGLGSVIMKRIVELHHGGIEIQNATSHGGTLLKIVFPREAL